jgi:glycosyltransferase involved in cell wall biosynthesis
MKILMLSIFSPHFFNWSEQLKDSGHEIFWLDIFDSKVKVEQINFVKQITGWRYRWNYPGRYFIKKHTPVLDRVINVFNERKLVDVFNNTLKEVKPDMVHSFVMSLAVTPIHKILEAAPNIKWTYSSWGSDLYFYENKGIQGMNIKKVLPRIDYMFTDCKRDYKIAQRNGFRGEFLGVFPGGGGYEFEKFKNLITPQNERKIILIKGYQGKHGRCKEVLKALNRSKDSLGDKKIIVFGADPEILNFVSQTELWFERRLEVFERISHFQVMGLMGKSLIYIGNSMSDGMPNTLLEAIVMEAFPIQSNPGGASSEIIINGKNGFLIQNAENSTEIAGLIMKSLKSPRLLQLGVEYNNEHIKPKLERQYIKNQVIEKYRFIEENL